MTEQSGQLEEQKQDVGSKVRHPVEQIESARIHPVRNAALITMPGARLIYESRDNSKE